jgi:hypothetical protein
MTWSLTIQTDSGGSPSGTLVHANATTGLTTDTPAVGVNSALQALDGSVTLSTGITYWAVLRVANTTVADAKLYFTYGYASTYTGFTPTQLKNQDSTLAWIAVGAPHVGMVFNFLSYPTTGVNTYIAPIADIGYTPTAAGTAVVTSINKGDNAWFGDDGNQGSTVALTGNYIYAVTSAYWRSVAGDHTFRWTIDTSAAADMSGSNPVTFGSAYTAAAASVSVAANTFDLSSAPGWVVGDRVVFDSGTGTQDTGLTDGAAYFIKTISSATISVSTTVGGTTFDVTGQGNNAQSFTLASQLALTQSITGAANLKRYYQVTMYFASSTGLSTPMITGLSLTFPQPVVGSFENTSYQLVGCKKSIFTTIAAGAATISTTEVPMGTEVRPAYFQQKIFWSTGGQAVKYWNGIAGAAATVASLTKVDGSAGVDPPARGSSLILHNDKLFLARGVEKSLKSGAVSTTQTATVLTDTLADFVTTNGIEVGFRVYPDVTNWPRTWYTITAVDADEITSSGSTMTDVATTGDTYQVTRQYKKLAFYTTDNESADWPTANFLTFGDGDEDQIQALMSWKNALYIICRSQIWRVTGYGPTTGLTKERVSRFGGTLSPGSVVDAADTLYWWTGEGIVQYTGGTTRPEVISGTIRDLAEDALNPSLRDEVTSTYFQGRVFWSYATSDSGVNNRTLIYDLATGNVTIRNWGMYCPERFIDEDSTETLMFWEPTSGCICEYDSSVITHAGSAPAAVLATQHITAADPTEMLQPLRLNVSLEAEGGEAISVEAAKNYTDTYTNIGALVPYGTEVSERTAVNATDSAYFCDFPATFQGTAISCRLLFSPQLAVQIHTMELVVDTIDSEANT